MEYKYDADISMGPVGIPK